MPSFRRMHCSLRQATPEGYQGPSIIAHGKPQGIVDVLEGAEGGLARHHNSRTADPLGEFGKLVFFLLHAARAIRTRFALNMEPVREVNNLHVIASQRQSQHESRVRGATSKG